MCIINNKTYYLCIEDKYLSYFISKWKYEDKPFSFTIRNAREGIKGSFVVAIKDENGGMIDFIAEIVAHTNAKIQCK